MQTRDAIIIKSKINAELEDISPKSASNLTLYDEFSYTESQKFSKEHYLNGSLGIHYDSVCDSTGKNVALFKENVISEALESRAKLQFSWNGKCSYINF